ncbi:hypothetical protein [Acidipropionibacterium virtanenii]|uniref:Carbohydrate kinase PfkB domain-containing protein n=1 Tax=Acidipropionibacterium virtanenii TaxID=2057246 RepID=A0A344UQ20_9ACTN|nr:hypothetical protein [Acidipropionibacterium virtanenii]AXE37368.1 hypothetical protein JS278_00171 [Acidipropionibacterium virtanenii]
MLFGRVSSRHGGVDHRPELTAKTLSVGSFTGAGGPATNAAVTFAALCRALGEGGVTGLLTALDGGSWKDRFEPLLPWMDDPGLPGIVAS